MVHLRMFLPIATVFSVHKFHTATLCSVIHQACALMEKYTCKQV